MTDHDHKTIVPGCYRCELGQEEEREAMLAEIAELRAEVAQLRDIERDLVAIDASLAAMHTRVALLEKHKETP